MTSLTPPIDRGEKMRLAIVGSRKLTTDQHATAGFVVSCVVEAYRCHYGEELVICSGGAKGIDSLAELEASIGGVDFIPFLPDKEQWEPDGYKDRNIRLAFACHELISIRARDSKSYGSGWTADYAESIGKMVRRIYV